MSPLPVFSSDVAEDARPTFTVGQTNLKQIQVDKVNGRVTFIAPKDAAPGTEYQVPIVATWPDKHTENLTATFIVSDKKLWTPTFGLVVEGKIVTGNDEDLSYIPADFQNLKVTMTYEGESVTGSFHVPWSKNDNPIFVNFFEDPSYMGASRFWIPEGANLHATVTGWDSEKYILGIHPRTAGETGAKVEGNEISLTWNGNNILLNFRTKTDADRYEGHYEGGSTAPGGKATIASPKFTDEAGKDTAIPNKTSFSVTPDSGATIDLNTGALEIAVPHDAAPGSIVIVPVTITYPDTSTEVINVEIVVSEPEMKPDEGTGENTGEGTGDVKPGTETPEVKPGEETGKDTGDVKPGTETPEVKPGEETGKDTGDVKPGTETPEVKPGEDTSEIKPEAQGSKAEDSKMESPNPKVNTPKPAQPAKKAESKQLPATGAESSALGALGLAAVAGGSVLIARRKSRLS
ncbi:YPDG domain-containing protein [Actinotignum sanguinis]|uniref:YPDG domain-containing protein n=1 Tax=Actinotignum sanguinis TaxID=1445614 RepID=UPI0013DEEA91|nr:YPDG domain-containing protein [Actinotignum sanguinis]MDY5148960.1 YPDG domain-containing protein [Actinotignum sanguinis]